MSQNNRLPLKDKVRGKVLYDNLHKVILKLSALGRYGCKIAKMLGLSHYTLHNIIKFHKSSYFVARKHILNKVLLL